MEASVKIKVPFYDLDPMKVVWHGNYIKYFEKARCALLEKAGLDYREMERLGYAFPVVKMSVKYINPSEFGQELEVSARIAPCENFLHIKYLAKDLKSGEKICSAETKQMCVSIKTKASCFELPAIIKERICR